MSPNQRDNNKFISRENDTYNMRMDIARISQDMSEIIDGLHQIAIRIKTLEYHIEVNRLMSIEF